MSFDRPRARQARILGVLAVAVGAAPGAATPGEAATSGRVLEEVTVASTPLGGLELPLDRIPGAVQRAQSDEIERAHRAGLAQFLDERLGSVFINEAQSNLLQPDVQFRGFTASPLLGQPQGVAVYQNGVRLNDPFGDTVNWVLIPEGAIESADLIAGSNPVFGLNALGGALSLRTKDGFTNPGTHAQASAGSFGRAIAAVESGGAQKESAGSGRLSYYANARYLTEEGWREHSPSDALHLFADVGWRDADTSVALNVARIEADLIGNGPAPVDLLAIDRDAVYTHPDQTQNAMTLVTVTLDRRFASQLQLDGVAYLRRSDIDALNGDESPYEACGPDDAFVCTDEGTPVLDPDGAPILSSDAVDGAVLNRSATNQDTYGASLQLGVAAPLAQRENRLILGGSYDRSTVRFGSSAELGSFDEERGVIAGGVLADEAFVDLKTRVDNVSVFVTDTYAVTPQLDLSASGRYNETRIELRDQIGVELNGDHTFSRFNVAAGLAYRLRPHVQLYANYGESNRAPSPVELTCADEDDPCALPNAFLSDPPLEQVVARTLEAGARGAWRDLRWRASLFRTGNANDILFISSGALTNRGFFDNVGDTRREGLELNIEGASLDARLRWFANYTRLRAVFLENFSVMSPHNPAAVDGEIFVERGARIPGVPEHILSAGASMTLGAGFTLGLDVKHQTDQYLRGDEANVGAPLAGYTSLNFGAEWRLSPTLTFFADIENVLDADYATFGIYGDAEEVLGEGFEDGRFVSPAAPLSAWVGVRWTL